MLKPGQRSWVFSCLLALLCLLLFVGCTSNQSNHKPTATRTPPKTSITQTGTALPSTTPSATATPVTACNGKLPTIVVPDGSALVGAVTTTGATIDCAYRVKQDLKTVDSFFKTQMSAKGWAFLNESQEGPLAMVQTYFQNQAFATITLSQHEQDTHSTDITISVEISQ
jgi:hypothetical protein